MISKTLFVIWKVLLVCIGIGVLGYVLYMYYAPFGKVTSKNDFTAKESMVSNISPEKRVSVIKEDENGRYKEIISEPIYFKVQKPRFFETVKVMIDYRSFGPSVINLGVKNSADEFAYRFEPVEFDLGWTYKISNDGVVMWQKKNEYSSIDEFINNLSELDNRRVVVSNYNDVFEQTDNYNGNMTQYMRELNLDEFDIAIGRENYENIGNDLKRVGIEFDISEVYVDEDNKLEFIISAPKVDGCNGKINIYGIEVEFNRGGFGAGKILNKIKK